jgi:hypothetical protein
MSCCGTSRPQTTKTTSVGTLQPFPISQQPSPHPRIDPFGEKQSFNPTAIPSPPPAHSFSPSSGNLPSPPPSSTTHGSGMSSSPPPPLSLSSQMGTFNRGTTGDAAGYLGQLQRPTPSYPSSGIPSLLSTYQPSVPVSSSPLPSTDEGKMSVAIDFGGRQVFTRIYTPPPPHPNPLIRRTRLELTVMAQVLLSRVW